MTKARRLSKDRIFTSISALLTACSVSAAGAVVTGCYDHDSKGAAGSSGSGAGAGGPNVDGGGASRR